MKKILLLHSLITSFCFSQPYFNRYDAIQVKINSNEIDYPWAGGLNFIQASNIDVNFDGINDLFLFDRSGNKIRVFINNGTVGAVDYSYAPHIENKFPSLNDWVLLADYNCDGKTDIFTYSRDIQTGGSGIKVYKNISSVASGLQFIEVKSLLYSTYWPPNVGSKTNLYVSSIDIPAISDIDGDGDLDIVTFAIGGVYLEYHKNMSKELYGTCDSLIYEVKNHCWGYASENYLTNNFSLNDTCVTNVSNPEIGVLVEKNRASQKHSGSCELCIDLNGDGVKEFITGDISFKNLTKLNNAGTITSAYFNSVDASFPLNNGGVAVSQTVFPCAYYVDINNDTKNDLLVSPNAPNASENYTSMMYYENIGTSSFPVFQYQQNNVIQENMIDVGEGAYPAFFDYDNDGLIDLFVGNYGYYNTLNFDNKIAYFKNIGTATTPKFELITRDFNNYSSLGIVNMVPAFGDLDGDSDADMIMGGHDGKLHYFENTAVIGAQANFVLSQANFKNSNNRVIDVGDYATPCIADVNGDGKNDLIIGSRNGKISYYNKLNSLGFPQMDSITNFFGNINVTAANSISGYSFPYVFKNNGKTEMLVGSEVGYLKRYDNIDGNLNGAFNLVDAKFLNSREGAITSPTGADIDNDGFWDLVIGNYSGGLSFYKGSTTAILENKNKIDWTVAIYPNPSNDYFNIQISNAKARIFKVELYSVLGQLILAEQINTSAIQLSTERLSQGIYICKVVEINASGNSTSGILAKRLVVKR